MSNDLEDEIRDALRGRAMSVTDDDLGRRDEPVRTGRRPILAALATAAVVAALAIGVGIAAWPSSHENKQPGPAAASVAVADTKWQFLRGIQETTNFTSPNRRVQVSFSRDGKFGAYDGVNYLSGSYTSTPDGLLIGPVGSTLVGVGNPPPNLVATQAAFRTFTSGHSPVTTKLNDAGELVLSGAGYSLWFRNAGPADSPTAPASPTSTGTPTGGPASYINGSELPASGAS